MAFTMSAPTAKLPGFDDAIPFVASGVAWLLRHETNYDELERALKHCRIAIDDAIADWFHLRVIDNGQAVSFREAAARFPRQRLAPVVSSIRRETGAFELTTAEAYDRVVSIYTIDWSNLMPYAPSVRARFKTDDRATQEDFLAEFLSLYDEGTDVTALHGAAEAAAWLRSVRRFRAQWTFILRAPVDMPDLGALEGELRAAMSALPDNDPLGENPYMSEMLTALRVPPARRSFLSLIFEARQRLTWLAPSDAVEDTIVRARRAYEMASAFAW